MGISDLFSKRQRRLRGEAPDVYTYDTIPQELRVQIVHIWGDSIGDSDLYRKSDGRVRNAYKHIVDTLCREYGVFSLTQITDRRFRDYLSELTIFILQEQDNEKVLDTIELSFQYIDGALRIWYHNNPYYFFPRDTSKVSDEAIEELNARFQQHRVGYQFTNGQIIRIDSELIHAEIVKPALALLHGKEYAGAQAEFLKAHENYRKGKSKETLNECLKALESTLKVICDKRGWKYPKDATSNALIKTCFTNGLIPNFWEAHFSAIRSTLENGVPTARNKLGGHGQGSQIVDVPPQIVAYVLQMTAAGIVFLVESEKNLK